MTFRKEFFRNLKKKKAIFFSFISILIFAFFMIIYSNMYASDIFQSRLDVKNAQINSADYLVKFVEEIYIPRMLRTSSRMATRFIVAEINRTNKPIALTWPALSQIYENLIMNATLYGTIGSHQPDMDDYKMARWFDIMSDAVDDDLHLDLEFNKSSVDLTVYQVSPWSVTVNLTFGFYVQSLDSEWDVFETYSIDFPIIGYYDPLYMMNSNKLYLSKIYQTNSTLGKDGYWINQSEFEDNLFNPGFYLKNSKSPSFLQRMMNDTTIEDLSECCGIFSLINPGKNAPSNNLDPGNNKSYVDYLFFNGTTVDFECTIDPDKRLYIVENITDNAGAFKLHWYTLKDLNLTMLYCGDTPTDQSQHDINCLCANNWPIT